MLRRRVWIDQRYFQWTPNFYIIFVAPPGVASKSTCISTGIRLLREVPGVHIGPSSTTWQALIKVMEESGELVPFGDVDLPMSCVTCAISELGTFFRPDQGDMIDVLTDLWDGQMGSWRREIKTDAGTHIENPWINIIGATTPAWMEKNFPAYLIGGGLTSRCVFVYGERKRRLVAYPADAIDEGLFAARGAKLIEDLIAISQMIGEYEMVPEAKAWGEAWYERHWSTRPDHMASEKYSGYIARKQTHLHKLAMVLAASERQELIITEDDMKLADRLVTALEHDMSKVFSSIGAVDNSRFVAEIVTFVQAAGSQSFNELWRKCMPSMDMPAFKQAMDSAIQAGYITQKQEGLKLMFHANAASARVHRTELRSEQAPAAD